MRLLYRMLFFIFSIGYLPFFFFKGKHREGFAERLGWIPRKVQLKLAGKKVVWIHAVSVGESILALHFLEALKKEQPSVTILITVTTPTAREMVQKKKKDEDVLLYLPVDFKGAVRRFADAVKPAALVLFETEIWPNLIWELSDRQVPIFIVNGRISEKALHAYQKVSFFLKPILNRIRKIGAQDETMKRRFLDLGADPARVEVTDNLKYALRPDTGPAAPWAEKIRSVFGKSKMFLLIAGSTHEGEEELLFNLYPTLAASDRDFRMLLAPRHVERVPAVLEKARALGVPAERLSEARWTADSLAPVLILDKMGVLSGLYAEAEAVFIGGSLVPVGGHNPTEPAVFGKAVLFGPHMQNFQEMAEEFVRSNAALRIQSAEELKERIEALAKDPERRAALGAAAKELIERHQSALRKNLEMILTPIKGVFEP